MNIEEVLNKLNEQDEVESIVYSLFEKLSPDEIQEATREMNAKLNQKNEEVKSMLSKNHEHLFISTELIEKLKEFLEVSKRNQRKILKMDSKILHEIEPERNQEEEVNCSEERKYPKEPLIEISVNEERLFWTITTSLNNVDKNSISDKNRIYISGLMMQWLINNSEIFENLEKIKSHLKSILIEIGTNLFSKLFDCVLGRDIKDLELDEKEIIENSALFTQVADFVFRKNGVISNYDYFLISDYLDPKESDEDSTPTSDSCSCLNLLISFLDNIIKERMDKNLSIDLIFLSKFIIFLNKNPKFLLNFEQNSNFIKNIYIDLINKKEIKDLEIEVGDESAEKNNSWEKAMMGLKSRVKNGLESLIENMISSELGWSNSVSTTNLDNLEVKRLKKMFESEEIFIKCEKRLNLSQGTILKVFKEKYEKYSRSLLNQIEKKITLGDDIHAIVDSKDLSNLCTLIDTKDEEAKDLLMKFSKFINFESNHLENAPNLGTKVAVDPKVFFEELRFKIITQLTNLNLDPKDSLDVNLQKMIIALFYRNSSKSLNYLDIKCDHENLNNIHYDKDQINNEKLKHEDSEQKQESYGLNYENENIFILEFKKCDLNEIFSQCKLIDVFQKVEDILVATKFDQNKKLRKSLLKLIKEIYSKQENSRKEDTEIVKGLEIITRSDYTSSSLSSKDFEVLRSLRSNFPILIDFTILGNLEYEFLSFNIAKEEIEYQQIELETPLNLLYI